LSTEISYFVVFRILFGIKLFLDQLSVELLCLVETCSILIY